MFEQIQCSCIDSGCRCLFCNIPERTAHGELDAFNCECSYYWMYKPFYAQFDINEDREAMFGIKIEHT